MKTHTLNRYMRLLHRDIGYFIAGLVLIYALSGIVLIYRDTDLLKRETQLEKKLAPGMEASELGPALHLRDFKLLKEENGIVWFQNGSYNKSTGIASYSSKELPPAINKLTALHKSASQSPTHWLTLLFGVLMLFMAVSSFWMFKANTKQFKRGVLFAGAGLILAVVLLLL